MPAMRSPRRRGPVGRGKTLFHQGPHAFPGALGAQTVLAGNGRRVSHLLGQGSRRGGVTGHVGPGASSLTPMRPPPKRVANCTRLSQVDTPSRIFACIRGPVSSVPSESSRVRFFTASSLCGFSRFLHKNAQRQVSVQDRSSFFRPPFACIRGPVFSAPSESSRVRFFTASSLCGFSRFLHKNAQRQVSVQDRSSFFRSPFACIRGPVFSARPRPIRHARVRFFGPPPGSPAAPKCPRA